ncbi:hypothetical protein ACKKBG_A28755 [Auxenochlorella protothecoides x Auxenochlorella symbiontica]
MGMISPGAVRGMRSRHRGHRSIHSTQQTSGMASEADVEEEDVSATAENVSDEILMWEEDALQRLWDEIPLHGYLGGGQSGCMRQHLAPHSRTPACACSGAGCLTGAQQACPPCLHPAMTSPDVLHSRASRPETDCLMFPGARMGFTFEARQVRIMQQALEQPPPLTGLLVVGSGSAPVQHLDPGPARQSPYGCIVCIERRREGAASGIFRALQRCMVLEKPGDYQAQPCRSVLPLPDDVCVPWEVAEGLTPWHPSLFAFNRGEDLLAERALELAQRLVPRGIRGVRVGDPASYIANWLANNVPISWIDQVKMFTAQTTSERLEIAAEALGRMGAVRCARCGHRLERNVQLVELSSDGITHRFVNPQCMHIPVIFMMAERPSTEWNGPLGSGLHSWLPGYGWLTTACMGCHLMLGWVFVPMHGQYPHRIWAIMRDHVGLTSGR